MVDGCIDFSIYNHLPNRYVHTDVRTCMTYLLAALVHLGEEGLQLRDLLVAVPQL